MAYSEIHDDEQGVTAAAFWRRARALFSAHRVVVRAVLTDIGSCYRAQDWLKEGIAGGALPRRTRPFRSQTNDSGWLHLYNHHRCHTALGGRSPVTRSTTCLGTQPAGAGVQLL